MAPALCQKHQSRNDIASDWDAAKSLLAGTRNSTAESLATLLLFAKASSSSRAGYATSGQRWLIGRMVGMLSGHVPARHGFAKLGLNASSAARGATKDQEGFAPVLVIGHGEEKENADAAMSFLMQVRIAAHRATNASVSRNEFGKECMAAIARDAWHTAGSSTKQCCQRPYLSATNGSATSVERRHARYISTMTQGLQQSTTIRFR